MINKDSKLNTAFLLALFTDLYCKKHKLSIKDFLELDKQKGVLRYIELFKDTFDCCPEEDGVLLMENFIERGITV